MPGNILLLLLLFLQSQSTSGICYIWDSRLVVPSSRKPRAHRLKQRLLCVFWMNWAPAASGAPSRPPPDPSLSLFLTSSLKSSFYSFSFFVKQAPLRGTQCPPASHGYIYKSKERGKHFFLMSTKTPQLCFSGSDWLAWDTWPSITLRCVPSAQIQNTSN